MSHLLERTALRATALVGLALSAACARSTGGTRAARPAAPLDTAAAARDTLATLSAGGNTTCLTTTSGAGWCWGALDPFTKRLGPMRIRGMDGRPALLRSLSPWGWNACGLTAAEDAACTVGVFGGWRDSAGMPPLDPNLCVARDCIAPLPLPGALPPGPVRAMATGFLHTCVLAASGAAFCWGSDNMGQLGNGTRAADSTGSGGEFTRAPSAVVGGLRFARLDAGNDFTCGVTLPDGAVYCWGYGQQGQTGDSAAMNYCNRPRPHYTSTCSVEAPARVLPESLPGDQVRPGDVRFLDVSAGLGLACATDVAGAAYCWGSNYHCALGRCRAPDSPRAHRIPMPGRAVQVGAGRSHACARTADRRVFCWGENLSGQLGSMASANLGPDGLPPDYRDTTDRAARSASYRDDPCFLGGRCSPAPVEVSPGRRWAALAVGTDHACALAEDDGGIYCWGGGDSTVFGGAAPRERCVNRSAQWKDVPCQATPLRVAGLPSLAAPAVARPRATTPEPVRVLVSRREVRVVFPRDTARAWGWSERQDPKYVPLYAWSVTVEGMDGPRQLALMARRRGTEARDFPSLEHLVRAAQAERCEGGMIARCSDSGMRATVEGKRVVLSLRDSAQIVRLFGMRPEIVTAWRQRPEEEGNLSPESVRVEYVAPELPVPDAAARAEAARARRRYEESVQTITRSIAGGGSSWGPLWLVVGDSAAVHIEETRCMHDACHSSFAPVHGSVWTVLDPGVARVGPAAPRAGDVVHMSPRETRYVKALRPGRAVLRVRGVTGPSDTAASSRPPARELERAVIVTRPIGRVTIVPRPVTVRVREPVTLRVRVVDRDGREIRGVPARLEVLDGDARQVLDASGPVRLVLTSPGRTRIVGRAGAHADTVTVTVAPTPAPRQR
jgi:hypothetical protein